jgi:alanine racemase
VNARADVVAWRLAFAERLAVMDSAKGTGVHVKLDSGMGRLGTRDAEEALAVAAEVAAASDLRLAGAMTHFATADDDPEFMREQLARFAPWAQTVRDSFGDVLVHAANSAATMRDSATHFDLVRCGIALYGMDPFQDDPAGVGLQPALELRTYVAEVKRAAPGESAGYGRRFVAERPTWIATLPVGYGDGVRRGLSNNADVLILGRRYPLVGTVSMDNVTVDLGPSPDEPAGIRGAPAVLLGRDGDDAIRAEDWARRLNTINYEVTCGLSARVPRVYEER